MCFRHASSNTPQPVKWKKQSPGTFLKQRKFISFLRFLWNHWKLIKVWFWLTLKCNGSHAKHMQKRMQIHANAYETLAKTHAIQHMHKRVQSTCKTYAKQHAKRIQQFVYKSMRTHAGTNAKHTQKHIQNMRKRMQNVCKQHAET